MNDANGRRTRAWRLLAGCVALHVADEALTDFLPFYNSLVLKAREQLGFFPMPTFEFPVWLGGLILLILVLFLIAPWIGQGSRAARTVAVAFSVLMVANGLGHLLGSVWFGRILPGFTSSPFLLAAAVYVLAVVLGPPRERS